jgi:hypothetical protein
MLYIARLEVLYSCLHATIRAGSGADCVLLQPHVLLWLQCSPGQPLGGGL